MVMCAGDVLLLADDHHVKRRNNMKRSLKAIAAALAATAIMSSFAAGASAEMYRVGKVGIDDEGIVHIFDESDNEKGLFTGYVQLGKQRSYYREGNCVVSRWMKIDGKKRFYADSEGIVFASISRDGTKLYLISESDIETVPLVDKDGSAELAIAMAAEDMYFCVPVDADENNFSMYIVFTDTSAYNYDVGSVIKVDYDSVYAVEEDGVTGGVIVQNKISKGSAVPSESAQAIIDLLNGNIDLDMDLF